MQRGVPLHHGFAVDVTHLRTDILGKQGLSADKVQLAQRIEHSSQFVQMRANLVSNLGKDAYNLAGNLSLNLADAVIGLDNGIRLYKDCFAAGALVMHDTMQFALVHRAHGHHQPAIAQRRLHIGLQDAVLLTLGDNSAQGSIDAAGYMGD